MTKPKLPQGIELSPLDGRYRDNPYPALARLREATRVYHDESFGRYILTHQQDVRHVLRDRRMSSDRRKSNPDSMPGRFDRAIDEDRETSILGLDDPDHRRLRGFITKAFTPKAVEAMRPRARQIAHALIDAIETDTFDFMADFASPYPTTVIAEMLGVPAENRDLFKRWSNELVDGGGEGSPEQKARVARAASDSLRHLFRTEIAKRRDTPSDDLVMSMVRAQDEGADLSDAEIEAQCEILLVAGNVTTTDLLGNGLKALLDHPEQMAKLRADPTLAPNAVEEMLRFDSPVESTSRVSLDETSIAGCPIHSGDFVQVSLAAANHDPASYEDPARFDIARDNARNHQAFGGGPHNCIGAPLARIEAQEALDVLLERFESIQYGSDHPYVYKANPFFRGLARLSLKVTRRQ